MFKNKLKSICIITIILSLLIIVMVSSAMAGDEWKILGIKMKETENMDNNIIAEINGNKIYESQLNRALVMQEFKVKMQKEELSKSENQMTSEEYNMSQPKILDKEAMLNKLVDDEILYQEAIKQGVDVSEEEVRDYIDKQKEYFKDEKDIYYKEIEQIAKGMGMTVDEYWEYSIPSFIKSFSINRLRQKIISQMPEEEQNDFDKADAYFNKFKEQLKKSGKYIITHIPHN